MYCFAWDVLKSKHSTKEEKQEADRITLDKMALASMQAEGLIAEMEKRGYGIPKVA